ncbi:hypothetical protein [Gordonia humi]|uniref:Low molecular weight antigen MTB12-like C-terminal domain-containing protein n=1 Tax=Gordonia humi TaxID=686429 RepID=A0A840EXS8_9ACTN|nr:hypothetical protein [Gordonia humi]MBB4135093.1 hypothetical protein [Gordonia humi]
MSQGDSYSDEQPYADEPQPQPQQAAASSGSKVSVPTILASAGVAAVVSALIVTIGVVGLATSDRFGSNNAAAQPTVVNLGSENQAAPGGTGTGQQQAPGETVVDDSTASAPTEAVAESNGDAGTGSGGATTQQQQGTAGQQQQTQQSGGQTPAPLTAGQLNTKVKTIMNTNASDSVRASELEGGQKALGSVSAVAEMLRVSGAGFSYKVVGPVTQNGETLNARLQMSLVGNGSRYLDLSWVWSDGKWKLSNTAVCAVAGYAMLPCAVG